jgi:glycerate dehydrogenase
MTQPRPLPDRRPRVLFFDPVGWVQEWSYAEEIEALAQLGVDAVIPEDRNIRDRALPDADVVVVSSVDQLTAAHVDQLERCVGILCYSAGMDAVDVEAATRAGIAVDNIRAGTVDVADHAMTLLLAAWRRLPTMTAAAAAGHWDLALNPGLGSVRRLEGKTLGIFGAGAVGRAVAVRARAFGMITVATYRRPEVAETELPHVPFERLLAESDALVLAASLNPETAGIINAGSLAAARPGLVIVNVGRGGLISERDLAQALDDGIVAAAGLDVRDPEPPDPSEDLLAGRLNVILTPHFAGLSVEAFASIHRLASEGIESLLREGGRL